MQSPTLVPAPQTSLLGIFICPAATWHHYLDALEDFGINLPKMKYQSALNPDPSSLHHLRKYDLQK